MVIEGGIKVRKYLGMSIAAVVFIALLEIYNLCFYVYAGVTNDPLSNAQIEQLQNQGYQVQPMTRHGDDHFVSELYVARLTASEMKRDRGTERTIDLVESSRRDLSQYMAIDVPNDPNVTASGGRWKDVPCYLVTIKPVILEVYTGGGKSGAPYPSGVEIWVDATTGKIITQTWLQ